MIIASYNNKIVTIPEHWSELTIEQAEKVTAIELPKITTEDFDWYQHHEKMNQYIEALTDIDTKLVNPISLNYIFIKYLNKFVYDLHSPYPTSYVPEMITYFKHKGITYLMPTNLNVGENVILQHGQNVKSFIEASNLLKHFSKMKSEGIKAFPLLIASVVKRERLEEFDEVEIARRGDDFKTLPMDVAWEVFFCLSLLTIKSVSDTQLFTKVRKANLKERLITLLGRLRLRKAELLADLKR